MPTNEPSGPGSSPAPMTKEARDLLVRSVNEVQAKIFEVARTRPPLPFAVRSELIKQKDELLNQYFAQLLRYAFGRCPFCNTLLEQVFDPWGLDGFWWQE